MVTKINFQMAQNDCKSIFKSTNKNLMNVCLIGDVALLLKTKHLFILELKVEAG